MSSNIGRGPDPFSLSPLLSLLPSLGSVPRLEMLMSSLFARSETAEAARESAESNETRTRYAAEAAMLRHILDWLSPQSNDEDSDE
jgi:hypothetical protein